MDAILSAKLARLANRATRYEISMSHPDGRKFLVCYATHKSRSAINQIIWDRGVNLAKIAGTDWLVPAKKAADGFTLGEWVIKPSGRTQRDAYMEGELPFIDDVVLDLVMKN